MFYKMVQWHRPIHVPYRNMVLIFCRNIKFKNKLLLIEGTDPGEKTLLATLKYIHFTCSCHELFSEFLQLSFQLLFLRLTILTFHIELLFLRLKSFTFHPEPVFFHLELVFFHLELVFFHLELVFFSLENITVQTCLEENEKRSQCKIESVN